VLLMNDQKYNIKKLKNIDISSFEYEEYGIKGVGKNRYPIISMDQYINHELDDELHIECCKGLALSTDYKTAMLRGAVLPEELSKFAGKDTWCQLLLNFGAITRCIRPTKTAPRSNSRLACTCFTS
jgi:hypothetical protein